VCAILQPRNPIVFSQDLWIELLEFASPELCAKYKSLFVDKIVIKPFFTVVQSLENNVVTGFRVSQIRYAGPMVCNLKNVVALAGLRLSNDDIICQTGKNYVYPESLLLEPGPDRALFRKGVAVRYPFFKTINSLAVQEGVKISVNYRYTGCRYLAPTAFSLISKKRLVAMQYIDTGVAVVKISALRAP